MSRREPDDIADAAKMKSELHSLADLGEWPGTKIGSHSVAANCRLWMARYLLDTIWQLFEKLALDYLGLCPLKADNPRDFWAEDDSAQKGRFRPIVNAHHPNCACNSGNSTKQTRTRSLTALSGSL
jgi:hypothetical protein